MAPNLLGNGRTEGRYGHSMPDSVSHILVVDDDPAIREGVALALKDTYVVHSAGTGEEACALLRRHRLAAIVLDAILGKEHGLDLIEKFRALSQAPVLILTGYGTEELAVRALRAKVDDYLRKPVNIRELRASLSRLTQQNGQPPDPVVKAHRLLVGRPERQHTTVSLAREVGLSERHLSRQFREAYGMSPRRYLTRVRMQRAASLLRTTRLGIEQVAQTVGYSSFATFDKLFKRAFGITPSEARAGLGETGPRDAEKRDCPGV